MWASSLQREPNQTTLIPSPPLLHHISISSLLSLDLSGSENIWQLWRSKKRKGGLVWVWFLFPSLTTMVVKVLKHIRADLLFFLLNGFQKTTRDRKGKSSSIWKRSTTIITTSPPLLQSLSAASSVNWAISGSLLLHGQDFASSCCSPVTD